MIKLKKMNKKLQNTDQLISLILIITKKMEKLIAKKISYLDETQRFVLRK